MFDDQPQAAAAQLVGGERSGLFATAAQLPVTRTIGALATYGLVVFLDFAYSCRAGQFDTDDEIFLEGERGSVVNNDLASPFSCARRPPKRREEGRGSR